MQSAWASATKTATRWCLGPVPRTLLLLRNLCDLHAAAETNSLYWDMLTALAKATKDDELLDLANICHQQTQRQATWARSTIKVLAPRALTESLGVADARTSVLHGQKIPGYQSIIRDMSSRGAGSILCRGAGLV
jgi:hypothetical protein